jgi:trehalose 6-phosphate synthase/phosphatase
MKINPALAHERVIGPNAMSGVSPTGRLLIASSRLPLSVSKEHGTLVESTGGVAAALRSVHIRSRDVWIGAVSHSELATAVQLGWGQRLASLGAASVELSDVEMTDFYSRYANGILWPSLHEVPSPMPGDGDGWRGYRAANQRFADALCAAYRHGDTIWVHDYQLMLVPAMVRRCIPHATIGFFLHTPVPPPAELRSIREWPELLAGVLGADAIGVHTVPYARHFIDAARGRVAVDRDARLVAPEGRPVCVHASPIGIDSHQFDGRARHPDVRAATATIRRQSPGPLFVGVDRLDYTKGIAERLRAFERLLRFEPGLHGRARFIQIAVPSRDGVAGYEATRRAVEALVSSINARFGTPEWAPVDYAYKSVDRDALIALYCAADVMVVTPRRDGMNLVAKEFVASRFDEDGMLVLSSTAGAASELTSAVLVDPGEVASIMEGYRRALDMSAAERTARMRRLRAAVRANDVRAWSASCLRALSTSGRSRPVPDVSGPEKRVDGRGLRVEG